MKHFTLHRITLFLLLWVGFGRAGFAQQNQIGRILGLSVEGNKISEAMVVQMSSGLQEGQEVTWEEIQRAVRQLWALGIFSDVRILLDRKTPEGVFLTIRVKEYPRLERTIIEGNKKIKKEDIEKEIDFFQGQVLSPSQIADAKRKLKKLYSGKGYTLAEIETKSFESEREGRAVLQITMNEGKKIQIKRIRFYGNTVFDDGKLRKQLKKTKEDRWWRGGDFDQKEYEEDKKKITEFYQNNGYRDAEIVKDSLYYDADMKDMFIDIWVREGHAYCIGKITWEGNTLFNGEHLVSLLEFKEGDPYSQEKFTKSIQEKIGGAYYDIGHIYAQINPKETLRGTDTLDVHFIISEGTPVKIRRIMITGNTRTKERVIRRELRIRPGDVFSRELLMRSHRDVMVLNYFANVIPNVLPVDENYLDLSFKVEEKSTDTANLSAGWSELDKLIGSIGLGMNNLFGNGQQLSLNWNFGRYYRSFSLGFTEPWFLNTPTLIGATIFDTKRDPFYVGYRQKSRGFSIRVGRRFRWPDNYFRGDWIYQLEEREFGDFNKFYRENFPSIVNEKWPQTTSGITQIISRNSLNHPEFPTSGSSVSLSTEITGGSFGGNIGYHKHLFSVEYFFPTFIPRIVFLTRAKVGFMDKWAKSGYISNWDAFFIGGSGLSRAEPLRGYDDPLAGGTFTERGGKTLIKTTVELRFPIVSQPTLFGLIFAEAGNTWIEIEDTDPFNLKRSVGIGARIFMPMVGMIGVDFAYGFDYFDDFGRRQGQWKTHFVFGKGF